MASPGNQPGDDKDEHHDDRKDDQRVGQPDADVLAHIAARIQPPTIPGASCLRLAVLEPKRMRPEPGFPVFQEVLVIPTFDHLAVSRRAFFPPEPGVLVGIVEGLLKLPVDGPALLE